MREKKYYLEIDDYEYSIIINSLNGLRNSQDSRLPVFSSCGAEDIKVRISLILFSKTSRFNFDIFVLMFYKLLFLIGKTML